MCYRVTRLFKALLEGCHSLQYFYTAVTPGISFPEFTAVGLVDGEQFVYYDSIMRKRIPTTQWMKKSVGADYWDLATQTVQGHEENFKVDIGTLMERFNHTKGIHTVQLMYGCELHDDGTKRGYIQDGYDGEDFLSLDLNTLTWTAPKPQAVITKNKWEVTGANAHQWKGYLENTCIEWLQKYVSYGKATLERKGRMCLLTHCIPPHHCKSATQTHLVCHATGFFPRELMISWKKNGEDLHENMELRETLPNQDGTFQKRSILTVSPEDLNNNKYTCVVQHSGLETHFGLPFQPGMTEFPDIGVIVGAILAVLLLLSGCAAFFIWRKKKNGKRYRKSKKTASVGIGTLVTNLIPNVLGY
uniref:Ig-like domain-containing protein n=1 Tax=Electrophorus electricus TaxID=8005 RepID=A0A4W4DWU7_ELEEL